jgi:hypothetical protein
MTGYNDDECREEEKVIIAIVKQTGKILAKDVMNLNVWLLGSVALKVHFVILAALCRCSHMLVSAGVPRSSLPGSGSGDLSGTWAVS